MGRCSQPCLSWKLLERFEITSSKYDSESPAGWLAAVGILAAQCAFVRKAERVVLIDNVSERLQFARDHIPKVETINFKDKKVITAASLRQCHS